MNTNKKASALVALILLLFIWWPLYTFESNAINRAQGINDYTTTSIQYAYHSQANITHLFVAHTYPVNNSFADGLFHIAIYPNGTKFVHELSSNLIYSQAQVIYANAIPNGVRIVIRARLDIYLQDFNELTNTWSPRVYFSNQTIIKAYAANDLKFAGTNYSSLTPTDANLETVQALPNGNYLARYYVSVANGTSSRVWTLLSIQNDTQILSTSLIRGTHEVLTGFTVGDQLAVLLNGDANVTLYQPNQLTPATNGSISYDRALFNGRYMTTTSANETSRTIVTTDLWTGNQVKTNFQFPSGRLPNYNSNITYANYYHLQENRSGYPSDMTAIILARTKPGIHESDVAYLRSYDLTNHSTSSLGTTQFSGSLYYTIQQGISMLFLTTGGLMYWTNTNAEGAGILTYLFGEYILPGITAKQVNLTSTEIFPGYVPLPSSTVITLTNNSFAFVVILLYPMYRLSDFTIKRYSNNAQ